MMLYRCFSLVAILCFTLFSWAARSQDIVIAEVLYNPVTVNERVKLTNTTGSTIDISNYWFCARLSYRQLSSSTVAVVSGNLNLGAGESVILEFTTEYLNNTASDLGLYLSGSFSSCSEMVDFVQWGGSFDFPAGRENVAVEACLWADEQFVATSGQDQALMFDGTNSGGSCNNCGNDGSTLTMTSDLFNAPTTLPVRILEFSVTEHASQIELNWTTASELNTSHFEIQRSLNGHEFTVIAIVEASGNEHQMQNYQYNDSPLAHQTIYYRLKYVDQDGSCGYSQVLAVSKNGQEQAISVESISTVPGIGQIDIEVDNKVPGIVLEVRIFTINGIMIYESMWLPDLGISAMCLDTRDFPSGIYAISIAANGKLVESGNIAVIHNG